MKVINLTNDHSKKKVNLNGKLCRYIKLIFSVYNYCEFCKLYKFVGSIICGFCIILT